MAAPLLSAVLAAASLPWGSATVGKVVLEAPGARSPSRLLHVFGVAEGGKLSRSEIRAGVQALLATEAVEDVVVQVEEGEAGITIRVLVQPASRIRSVEILGLPSAEAKKVRAALGLRKGALFWVLRFEAALDQARQTLSEDGYPQAILAPDLRFDRATGEVAVRVEGSLGRPLTVHALEAPALDVKPGDLWEICKLKPGRRLTSAGLDGARQRLASYLRREGYWEAEVRLPVVSEGADGATVRLDGERGPRYELDLEGLKRSKSLEVDALPFLRGEETFNEAALGAVIQRVRMYLQRDGRLLATVDGGLTSKGPIQVLTLKVDAGPKTPVEAVRFPGLRSVPEKEVRQKVGARTGSYWRWGGEGIDDDTLSADAASVLATLRAAGFADAQVEAPRIVASREKAVIEFPVVEGARSLVSGVAVEGAPADVTLPPLPLTPNGPWSQGAEDQARSTLEAAIRDAGYVDARVSATHACQDDRCAVRLQADPGTRVIVERVVTAGLVATNPAVVEKVARLKPGEAAGPDAQLAAQRRLLGLGIFQSVSVHPIPDQDTGTRRGLVIDLNEGPTGAYAFGLGYDTEQKVQVSLSWSELNLFGTGRSLTFDSRFSHLENRFQLTYREPESLGLLRFPTSVSIYQTEQTFTSYDVFQRGLLAQFGDERKRPWRFLLRFNYQMVDNTAPPAILSDLERSQQNLHIASLTPSLAWDTRDDMLVPHQGAYASIEWQHAFKLFQADAEFDLLGLQFSSYLPVAGGIFAFSLRGGGIQPRNPVPNEPDNLQVPVNVRFFAGGRASHRAFPIDLLGIPNETLGCVTNPDGSCQQPVSQVAIGGAGMAITNLEWRFPIYSVLGGTVFVDGGNVWSSWRAINTGQMRWGAGIGLRADTPVGPIRLEYGWKFRAETYLINGAVVKESPGELFFAFGNAF